MNRKGICFSSICIILGAIIVIGALWLFALPPVINMLNSSCNALESKYSGGNAWEEICLNPNDQAAKDALAPFNANFDGIALDRENIVKIECKKTTSILCPLIACWQPPTGGIKTACNSGEICKKNEGEQGAACISQQVCTANETKCRDASVLQTCSADGKQWTESPCALGCENNSCKACNNNGICDAGETTVTCPNDCTEL
ncbi:MAG: hypothetical protein PHH08_01040 [Candidatus ainarchaeum sp.]|nr:hypothetical protein [Candidatus ainarchaeum sp.]